MSLNRLSIIGITALALTPMCAFASQGGGQAHSTRPTRHALHKANAGHKKNKPKSSGGKSQSKAEKDYKASLHKLYRMTPQQIRAFHRFYSNNVKASRTRPPQITTKTQTVHVTPGGKPKRIQVGNNDVATLAFFGSQGQPWPVKNAVVGNRKWFGVMQPKVASSNVLTISGKSLYAYSNLSVMLKGLPTPVIVELRSSRKHDDGLVNMHLTRPGPNAHPPTVTPPPGAPVSKSTNAFIDGVAPKKAKPLAMKPAVAGARAWRYQGSLYFRSTRGDVTLVSPASKSVNRGAGGVRVYVAPYAPTLLVSEQGADRFINLSQAQTAKH